MIEVKRKEGESSNAFLYRFTKKIQQSGLLKEARRKRFHLRKENKRAKKEAALYRINKKQEIERLRKLGR